MKYTTSYITVQVICIFHNHSSDTRAYCVNISNVQIRFHTAYSEV